MDLVPDLSPSGTDCGQTLGSIRSRTATLAASLRGVVRSTPGMFISAGNTAQEDCPTQRSWTPPAAVEEFMRPTRIISAADVNIPSASKAPSAPYVAAARTAPPRRAPNR